MACDLYRRLVPWPGGARFVRLAGRASVLSRLPLPRCPPPPPQFVAPSLAGSRRPVVRLCGHGLPSDPARIGTEWNNKKSTHAQSGKRHALSPTRAPTCYCEPLCGAARCRWSPSPPFSCTHARTLAQGTRSLTYPRPTCSREPLCGLARCGVAPSHHLERPGPPSKTDSVNHGGLCTRGQIRGGMLSRAATGPRRVLFACRASVGVPRSGKGLVLVDGSIQRVAGGRWWYGLAAQRTVPHPRTSPSPTAARIACVGAAAWAETERGCVVPVCGG